MCEQQSKSSDPFPLNSSRFYSCSLFSSQFSGTLLWTLIIDIKLIMSHWSQQITSWQWEKCVSEWKDRQRKFRSIIIFTISITHVWQNIFTSLTTQTSVNSLPVTRHCIFAVFTSRGSESQLVPAGCFPVDQNFVRAMWQQLEMSKHVCACFPLKMFENVIQTSENPLQNHCTFFLGTSISQLPLLLNPFISDYYSLMISTPLIPVAVNCDTRGDIQWICNGLISMYVHLVSDCWCQKKTESRTEIIIHPNRSLLFPNRSSTLNDSSSARLLIYVFA